jgi:hypothetical protein
MARRKLTDEERHFRKIGTGIPFSRWWPVLAIVLALIVLGTPQLFLDCVGLPLDSHGRRIAALKMLLLYPCSPFLLRGGLTDWLSFALLWMPLPFAVVNWRWAARQRRYWNKVRRREAQLRKAKASANKSEQMTASHPSDDA